MDIKEPTRLEIIDKRIINIEKRIKLLINNIGEDNIQVQKIKRILEQAQEQKAELTKQVHKSDQIIDSEITKFKKEGLITLNVEVLRQKHKLSNKNDEYNNLKEEILRLNSQLTQHKSNINELISVNKEIMQVNILQEEHINKLKSNAYGGDISSKYEITKYKMSKQDNKIYDNINMNNNLWDKENIGYTKNNGKFEEFSKENQLWLGNVNNNIEKIKNDNSLKSSNLKGVYNNMIGNNADNNNVASGSMKKYGSLVMNK